MRVRELMEQLSKMPPGAEVAIYCCSSDDFRKEMHAVEVAELAYGQVGSGWPIGEFVRLDGEWSSKDSGSAGIFPYKIPGYDTE